MNEQPVPKTELLNSLPPAWSVSLLPAIAQQVAASQSKVVVLDDDPTGTQTVHGITVLTEWSVATIETELQQDAPAFYILTNSRSLPSAAAEDLNREIGQNLLEASRATGRDFAIVSRSDSTLRGHFPQEVEALEGALGQAVDGWIIFPFFLEGGRYTINDVHYVAEGDTLVPAGHTEFARDSAFGYQASNLREWVAEKTNGRVSAEDVVSISIADLRDGGPQQVAEKLSGLAGGGACVVNAASMRDMEVFVNGLLLAEAAGKRFLYRTAASFVQVRAGLSPQPLLTAADLDLPDSGGGLIVVGSYVPRTTSQLESLLQMPDIAAIEVNVAALLEDGSQASEIKRVIQAANQALGNDQDVVIYTSRKLVTADDAERSLSIGQRISDSMVAIVQGISVRPRYLLAKGGITSSDTATKGLGVKRALVRGQILPGVPLWELGAESRYPGMPYIVFPGNVGDAQSLVKIVQGFQ